MGCLRNVNGQMIIGGDLPRCPGASNHVVGSSAVHIHLYSHFFSTSQEQYPLFLKYHVRQSQLCFFVP